MPVVQKSPFTVKVLRVVKAIPKGKVSTYKQVAELSGSPHASRGVSWILHTCSTLYQLPWHRVINSKGGISFDRKSHNFREQKRRLVDEKINVTIDGFIDLAKYQWKKKPKKIRAVTKDPKIFSK